MYNVINFFCVKLFWLSNFFSVCGLKKKYSKVNKISQTTERIVENIKSESLKKCKFVEVKISFML